MTGGLRHTLNKNVNVNVFFLVALWIFGLVCWSGEQDVFFTILWCLINRFIKKMIWYLINNETHQLQRRLIMLIVTQFQSKSKRQKVYFCQETGILPL